MKFIILVLIIASAVAQAPDWKEKAQSMQKQYEEVRDVCTNKLGLSSKEMTDAESLEHPYSSREKCILACLLEELGLMEDGKFSRNKSDSIAEYLYDDDPSNLAIAKSVSKKCEKAVEAAKLEDNCEIAGEIILCIKKLAKQIGAKVDADY